MAQITNYYRKLKEQLKTKTKTKELLKHFFLTREEFLHQRKDRNIFAHASEDMSAKNCITSAAHLFEHLVYFVRFATHQRLVNRRHLVLTVTSNTSAIFYIKSEFRILIRHCGGNNVDAKEWLVKCYVKSVPA